VEFELSVSCSNEIGPAHVDLQLQGDRGRPRGQRAQRIKTDVGTYPVAVLLNDTTYTDGEDVLPS